MKTVTPTAIGVRSRTTAKPAAHSTRKEPRATIAEIEHDYMKQRWNGRLSNPKAFAAAHRNRLADPRQAQTLADRLILAHTTHKMLLEQMIPGCGLKVLLGSGGFGEVYEATVTTTANSFTTTRECALKIVAASCVSELDALENIFEKGLHHEHLLPIYGLDGIAGDFIYYTMPLARDYQKVPGTATLQQLLGKVNGPLKPQHTTQICKSVGLALQYLHEVHAVVHRDVKPSNIFSTGTNWMLGDLGLLTDARLPVSGAGTEDFMPKDFDGFTSVQMDLYALGITLAQCMLKVRPAEAPGKIRTVPMSSQTPESKRLWEVIKKACHAEPTQRFASAAELLHHLEHGELLVPLVPAPVAPAAPAPKRREAPETSREPSQPPTRGGRIARLWRRWFRRSKP